MVKKSHVPVMLVCFSFLLNAAFATTYYVKKGGSDENYGNSWDEAFLTITKALDVVTSPGAVWVAEGTYQEGGILEVDQDISLYGGFAGNETDLSRRDFENHKTIIDGEKIYGCVKNYGLLDGFYVTNGKTDIYGGGIYNSLGSVAHCAVYGNTSGWGAGIYNWEGSVTSCTLHHNTATRNGGGIDNSIGSSMTNCTVYGNTSDGNGGGIQNFEGVVDRCTVYGNTSQANGGGISNLKGSVSNCTVYDNSAEGLFITGGGIHNSEGSVTNCTVYGNAADDSGDGIYNIYSGGSVTGCISWNHENEDIAGNLTNVSYSCFGESGGDNHNISSDPMFVNTSGDPSTWDFHLQSASPCIDSGTGEGAPDHDIEGVLRPQGDGFDMGAFEYPFPDSAKFISQVAPLVIPVGEQFDVSIIMKNIGTNTWTTGKSYRLGDCATTNSLWGLSRVPLAPGETVTPDETTSFTFTITAPGKKGEYDFQWRMIKEPGEKWFGEKTPLVRISVSEDIPGDVNNDGSLTMEDVNLLRDHLLGITLLDPEAMDRAEANLDGRLDAADMICILLGCSG